MDKRVVRTIRNIGTLDDLAQLETNASARGALTPELKEAIRLRSAELGRTLVAQRTALDLSDLSPAEEKIVEAVSEYVGVMKRQGKDATRTLLQLRNRGLLESAETAVAKATPTQGFRTLAESDLANLSYEQIIIDHPDEFSARALWYARRTLGLPNETDRPPSRGSRPARQQAKAPYWVFVCNPKKWAIDRFLDRRVEHDTWGIRPSDRARFAPGQLGIIRVGVDRRSVEERNGNPPLDAGIYAVCEIESEAFAGTGASDEFWAPGEAREPGWPTVTIRYLRAYLDRPLTIEALQATAPEISPLLLNGFQAASFPISRDDFQTVVRLLGEDIDALATLVPELQPTPDKLALLEQKYLKASPEVKARVSKSIERGPIGALVKKRNGFRCQLCATLGMEPVGFKKPSGEQGNRI